MNHFRHSRSISLLIILTLACFAGARSEAANETSDVSKLMDELRVANKSRKWSETIYTNEGWRQG